MSKKLSNTQLDPDTIHQYDRENVLYLWTAQKGFNPIIVDHAKGNYFYDTSGKQYLDFTSMFVYCNLGHGDPAACHNQLK